MLRRKSQSIGNDRRVGNAYAVCSALVIVAASIGFLCGARHTFGAVPVPLPPVQPAATAPPAALPEPIYWKQHLFLIPYQWGSAAEPGAARAVWLFVSKDRGASWQKISEAKPD